MSSSNNIRDLANREYNGLDELDAMNFLAFAKEKMKLVEMHESLMNRAVNEGFSGGEKKRNEVFQRAVLEPKLAILDETDSGLDIDALRIVAMGVNALRSRCKTNARQTNKNLLLSKGAGINTIPQLEIFADDFKCPHGATIGQLNEEELFYLRSRGIENSAAKTLLTYAFASELLGAVKIKPIQCQIDLVLLNRLSRG